MARLLTGLYLPTGGHVTWDDIDLADLGPVSVWKATAMVPQDYTRWPLAALAGSVRLVWHHEDDSRQWAMPRSGGIPQSCAR
ncbi:hypothetical protein [Streptomyces paromomycinus]|uniref:hypothetical protein n=1 Tax=Streptomyces paromomycinus TaxID=92743 RepID=UPI0035311F06